MIDLLKSKQALILFYALAMSCVLWLLHTPVHATEGNLKQPITISTTLTATVAFSDQSFAAGLAFTVTNPPPASRPVEMMPGGAAGDFNHDGWVDLFILGRGIAPDRLFLNQGDGTFTNEAGAWGVAVSHLGAGAAVGDYNGDGWLDLYITSHGVVTQTAVGQHKLYQNQAGAGFIDVAQAAGVNQTSTSTPDGFGASFGDYDLDGDLDLAVAGWQWLTPGVHLFQNQGDGTFTEQTVAAGVYDLQFGGFSPCFNDMDGDRWPELLVAADFGSTHYFRNAGDGTFIDETESAGITDYAFGMGSAVADLNNDGHDDWMITSIYEAGNAQRAGNRLYFGRGAHHFEDAATAAGVANGFWGWGVVAVDVDHDGWLDLVETNGWAAEPQFENNPGRLWLNNGDETFTDVATAAGFDDASQGRGLLHFDYDRDGDQDIAVIDRFGQLQLYRNDSVQAGKHWLQITLETGHRPDLAPNGIGARIEVIDGDNHYYRTVNGCTSYLSQSELTAHLGMGDAEVVDVNVYWSDGETSMLSDVMTDQNLTIDATTKLYLPIISQQLE